MSNAYLKEHTALVAVAEHFKENGLAAPQNVLEQYTDLRTQTAVDLETSVADKSSLRTKRVIRRGLEFEAECNPDKNLQSNKDAFIEELLRERACELGMEDARFFDLIRYKRADIFEKQLHGLFIYRLDDNGVRRDLPWRGNDEGKMAYPTHFEYEKFELNNPTRYWWTNGFDPKWYLSPFPSTEVNKGYGLVQNPGW